MSIDAGVLTAHDPRSKSWPSHPVLLRAAIELFVAAAVFVVYRAGRLVTSDSITSARANAERVLDAQRWLIGTMELNVQRWVLDVPGAIEVLNHYYVFVHFPATTIFLVWAFARHRDRYPAIRNWFVGVTLAAMVIHVVFPLAPPRMLDGYVDTLRVYGPNIYPEDPSRSLANQFAAMPSLHFGWALMVAIGIITVTTNRRRWWWLAHPALTLLAIVATGNHYLLDAAVAAAIALVVGLIVVPRRNGRFDSLETLESIESVGSRQPVQPLVPLEQLEQFEQLEPLEPVGAPLNASERRATPTRRHSHRRCVAEPAGSTAAVVAPPVRGTPRNPCRDDDRVSVGS